MPGHKKETQMKPRNQDKKAENVLSLSFVRATSCSSL